MVGKQLCHEIKSIGKTFYGNINNKNKTLDIILQ